MSLTHYVKFLPLFVLIKNLKAEKNRGIKMHLSLNESLMFLSSCRTMFVFCYCYYLVIFLHFLVFPRKRLPIYHIRSLQTYFCLHEWVKKRWFITRTKDQIVRFKWLFKWIYLFLPKKMRFMLNSQCLMILLSFKYLPTDNVILSINFPQIGNELWITSSCLFFAFNL